MLRLDESTLYRHLRSEHVEFFGEKALGDDDGRQHPEADREHLARVFRLWAALLSAAYR
jgi:hypothetical protein